MQEKDLIKRLLSPYAPECGFVSFDAVLPLLECRAKFRLPQDAQTVIVCLFPYAVSEQEGRNLSRYAIVEDYHVVVTKRLKEACDRLSEHFSDKQFVPFADNSPIREVTAAVCAGLGVKGKNQLFLHPRYGSYVFIGEIVTDLPVDVPSFRQNEEESRPLSVQTCIGCGKCLRACPAGALTEVGMDKEKCLSHITQKKGSLTPEEENLIRRGKLLWGCDICQEVCPYNQELSETSIPEFRENVIAHLPYHRIEELTKTRAFGFRGSGVLKRNYEILYGKQG